VMGHQIVMILVIMVKIYQESTSKHRHQQQAFHLRLSIDMPHGKTHQDKI
jgi:hypothetical protein